MQLDIFITIWLQSCIELIIMRAYIVKNKAKQDFPNGSKFKKSINSQRRIVIRNSRKWKLCLGIDYFLKIDK